MVLEGCTTYPISKKTATIRGRQNDKMPAYFVNDTKGFQKTNTSLTGEFHPKKVT